MRNRVLDGYLADLRARLPGDQAHKERLVAQARDQLEEDARRRLLADHSLSLDDAVGLAIGDFGSVDDIVAAHGGLRQRSTGRVLVRHRPAGRPVIATIAILGAILLGIVVLAAAFTLTSGSQASTPQERLVQRTLLQRQDVHQLDTQVVTDRFTIRETTATSSIAISITPTQGCAFYALTGPDGAVSDSTGSCSAQNYQTSQLPAGDYSLEFRLVGFSGTVVANGVATDRVPA